MQRELRRFAHGTDEQQDAGHRHQRPLDTREQRYGCILEGRSIGEHVSVIERTAEVVQHHADTHVEDFKHFFVFDVAIFFKSFDDNNLYSKPKN